MRVETGVVQFGDDWPGVFIRGDDAFYLSTALTGGLGWPAKQEAVTRLIALLASCDVRQKPEPQRAALQPPPTSGQGREDEEG